jgi:NAD(P)-dependent dehydrogenase (short-subunit alcohol dehydrogenase family)
VFLEGDTVVVTGAGGGIGRAIAQAAADNGAVVIPVDTDHDAVQAVANAVGTDRAAPYTLDVGSAAECARLRRELDARGLHPSVLVNSAGVIRRGRVDDDSAVSDWNLTMRVDLSAPFLMAREFVTHLESRSGSIVNVGSIQSFVHAANSVAYTAAKHGVLGLTRAMADELGPRGIRVNGVAPGLVETEFNRHDLRTHPERLAAFVNRSSLRRLATPDAVADAVVFLCSRLARGITGVMLPVDAGYLCV